MVKPSGSSSAAATGIEKQALCHTHCVLEDAEY
jgi:hypothetical protein